QHAKRKRSRRMKWRASSARRSRSATTWPLSARCLPKRKQSASNLLPDWHRSPRGCMRQKQTLEQRRERARLRALRWRRAHGIGPRKPAQRSWLALGISRSTYYRRRAKAREQAALLSTAAAREAVLDRLAWQIAELRASLDKCAAAHEAMAREL